MAKVSLEKHNESSELQEINRKLDFLINEVQDIRRDMKNLQAQNEDEIYKLNSRFYKVCNELQAQFFEFQSKLFSNSKNVSKQIRELQNNSEFSKLTNKTFSITSTVLFSVMFWILALMIILD